MIIFQVKTASNYVIWVVFMHHYHQVNDYTQTAILYTQWGKSKVKFGGLGKLCIAFVLISRLPGPSACDG